MRWNSKTDSTFPCKTSPKCVEMVVNTWQPLTVDLNTTVTTTGDLKTTSFWLSGVEVTLDVAQLNALMELI